MHADWTVACAADDPWVVVPWSSKDATICYIDLRAAPGRLNEIPEAAQYPCIAKALRRWNQPDTSLFTAKCDVWNYAAKFFDAEDLPGFDCAHGSYIDLLPIDPEIFSSFATCERQLRMWTGIARSIDVAASRCEWTLRRARVLPSHLQPSVVTAKKSSPLDGFATSLYVWGYGSSQQSAASAWAAALESSIEPVLLLVRQ